jgi:hypothetical protein
MFIRLVARAILGSRRNMLLLDFKTDIFINKPSRESLSPRVNQPRSEYKRFRRRGRGGSGIL